MSSTNRNNQKADPSEFYRTPAWVVDCLLPHVGRPRIVVDLGCGEGDISAALADQWTDFGSIPTTYFGVEKDAARVQTARARGIFEAVAEADVTLSAHDIGQIPPHWQQVADLVIFNPPFSVALDFVRAAMRLVRPGGIVAALHRESWLSTIDRATFARSNPCDKHVIPRRVSFQKSERACPACAGNGLVVPMPAGDELVKCKRCKGKGQLTSANDSVPHAWHVWRPGLPGFGGRWTLCEVPETPV